MSPSANDSISLALKYELATMIGRDAQRVDLYEHDGLALLLLARALSLHVVGPVLDQHHGLGCRVEPEHRCLPTHLTEQSDHIDSLADL